jgi:hypothetical protein
MLCHLCTISKKILSFSHHIYLYIILNCRTWFLIMQILFFHNLVYLSQVISTPSTSFFKSLQ